MSNKTITAEGKSAATNDAVLASVITCHYSISLSAFLLSDGISGGLAC
jgi:hypothetical protein